MTKTKLTLLLILVLSASVFYCTEAVVYDGSLNGWLIPPDEIYDGGPGLDGIPSLQSPTFVEIHQAGFLYDNELVIGVKFGEDVRAYPFRILDWHEIINDNIDDYNFSVTYCPLTGSGIVWEGTLEGDTTTFGVSGLLYNSNLIPYDRSTGSYWSQMKMQSINGPRAGERANAIRMVETTWKTWREAYPNTRVVSTQTGYTRNYGQYPYGGYRVDDGMLLFPVNHDDGRLRRKERVHGIIVNDSYKAFRFESFTGGITLISENYAGEEIVTVGSGPHNFISSFYRSAEDGTLLTFNPANDSLPAAMTDNEGNTWSFSGEALSGPRTGEYLEPVVSFKAYWFAWAAFYPETEIHGF